MTEIKCNRLRGFDENYFLFIQHTIQSVVLFHKLCLSSCGKSTGAHGNVKYDAFQFDGVLLLYLEPTR